MAVGGFGARDAERGRRVRSGAEREDQGQTRGKALTERQGRRAEQPVRRRSFAALCRCTNTGTHTRREKAILTVTLSTRGGLERRKAGGGAIKQESTNARERKQLGDLFYRSFRFQKSHLSELILLSRDNEITN